MPLYDRTKYACERLTATATDGTKVPISMVWSSAVYPDGPSGHQAPLMLYGYGSYGHSVEPDFDYTRLAYLDRGVVFAMAHIRGGGEMGRPWCVAASVLHTLHCSTNVHFCVLGPCGIRCAASAGSTMSRP